MTRDEDRVAVPPNGRRPYPAPDPTGAPHGDETEADETGLDIETAAFTPTQMAVGFGIVASLILLLLRRRRRRR